ncbi:hypothetical protein [Bosea sp. 2RAB26]|uniref:hypothetical protein n=1 Tax=Bosea sp. 2RAB26 TaxID=3237476 RepID=UPI003F92FCFB
MTYTILSAQYANQEHTAAVAMTEEAAAVLTSQADTPDLWVAVHEWGEPLAFEPPPVTVDTYRAAIQAHVDATAQQRSYDSGITCASYVNSTVPEWAAQAAAFVAWRDAVWAHAYTELAKVEGGQRPLPSVAAIIFELPAIAWPAP